MFVEDFKKSISNVCVKDFKIGVVTKTKTKTKTKTEKI